MLLHDLPHVLRAAGLDVVEVAGWATHMRSPMEGVNGIVCHHTGSRSQPQDGKDYPSLGVVRDGRDLGTPSELKGPLANLGLGFSGRWYVISAGKANHAGETLRPEWDSWHMIGIEAQGDGVSVWPAAQYRSYAVGCEALSAHYGFDISEILGHKEVCSPPGRKDDPNFSMTAFRALVAQIRQEKIDMITDDDVKKILGSPIDAKFTDKPGDTVTVGDALGLAQRWALHSALRSQQIEATVTELNAKLGTLSAESAQLRTDIEAMKAGIDQLLSRP